MVVTFLQSMSKRRASLIALVLGSAIWAYPSRAPATIEEQRARLPPPAECADEIIAGTWRSHSFHERYGEWYVFTLEVRRSADDPNRLEGNIQAHFWMGGPEDEEPPPCSEQSNGEWIVSMDGEGHVEGNDIQFGGVGRWRLDRTVCGSRIWGYNLDVFTGTVDPSILEFQSVDNDGGRAVNEPAVFRRIRCPPMNSAVAPETQSRPPAFYPSYGGCSWF